MSLEITCTLAIGLLLTFAECSFNGLGFIPEKYDLIVNLIFPKVLGVSILAYLFLKYILKLN